jgi:pseudouridine-5'-phosphate glycosidase
MPTRSEHPRTWRLVNRAGPCSVALETTVLVHGVPRDRAPGLARDLGAIVHAEGARPVYVGVCAGRPTVGLDEGELQQLLSAASVAKANTSNLGLLVHARAHAATTVSATMELASGAGVSVFATGGLGGVHRGYADRLDVSADLGALARFPLAVVSSGVKSILDVESTREALETLGVPVVGFGTDRFPAFYARASGAGVDARFDDASKLASFLRFELARSGRAVLVAHPIPEEFELKEADWSRWLGEATKRAEDEGARGRDVTPRVLALLHEVSGGATLRANIELIRANTRLAGALAREMSAAGRA